MWLLLNWNFVVDNFLPSENTSTSMYTKNIFSKNQTPPLKKLDLPLSSKLETWTPPRQPLGPWIPKIFNSQDYYNGHYISSPFGWLLSSWAVTDADDWSIIYESTGWSSLITTSKSSPNKYLCTYLLGNLKRSKKLCLPELPPSGLRGGGCPIF